MASIVGTARGDRLVYWDEEWEEFTCRPKGVTDSDSWYHTDSRQDAMQTACTLAGNVSEWHPLPKFAKVGKE